MDASKVAIYTLAIGHIVLTLTAEQTFFELADILMTCVPCEGTEAMSAPIYIYANMHAYLK